MEACLILSISDFRMPKQVIENIEDEKAKLLNQFRKSINFRMNSRSLKHQNALMMYQFINSKMSDMIRFIFHERFEITKQLEEFKRQ